MTPDRLLVLVLAAVLSLASSTAVAAQPAEQIEIGGTVTFTTAAPVYLLPDRQRVPLRTLPVGTTAVVERVQDEWIRITFNDVQFGRRTGWVETKFVRATAAPKVSPPPPPPRPGPKPGAAKPQPTRPTASRVRRLSPSGRLFGAVAFDRMTAAESFKAITDSDGLPSFGFGAQGVNLWRRLFLETSVEYSRTDGERVFVFGDEVFKLGIPIKLRLLPIDVVGGWRFPGGRVTPMIGGGVTFVRYEETSEFSDPAENVKEWHTGFTVMGGVEIRLAPQMHLRTEVRYRAYHGALGSGGVSGEFDESTLGGVGAVVKVVFGR